MPALVGPVSMYSDWMKKASLISPYCLILAACKLDCLLVVVVVVVVSNDPSLRYTQPVAGALSNQSIRYSNPC